MYLEIMNLKYAYPGGNIIVEVGFSFELADDIWDSTILWDK